MHEKVILFTRDREFLSTCSLALPHDISFLFLNEFSLLENFLSSAKNKARTVVADWDSVFFKERLDALVKSGSHRLFYFSSRIEGSFVDSKRRVGKIPFDLKCLVKENPELFFDTDEKNDVRKAEGLMQNQKTLLSLAGHSPLIENVRNQLKIAAQHNCSVLLTGESGTGKSLAAVIIHNLSQRKNRQLVMENVAAISEGLGESELFGSVAGAFTGAEKNRKGLFGEAEGSTLFLDEIGELSPSMQSKLLQVLQEGILRPVGEGKGHRVDVRTIFATNGDLRQLMALGKFRKDLFYRISQLEIRLPSLRQRPEDINELCMCFFEKEKVNCRLTEKALEEIKKWPWEGNIRELETVLRRAIIYARENEEKSLSEEKMLILDLNLLEFCRQDLQLL